MKFLPLVEILWVLQKVIKQGRNGNVGEFNLPHHDQVRLCARLILVESQRHFKQYYYTSYFIYSFERSDGIWLEVESLSVTSHNTYTYTHSHTHTHARTCTCLLTV